MRCHLATIVLLLAMVSVAQAERVRFTWSGAGTVKDVIHVPPGPDGLLCFSENLGKEFRITVTGYDEFIAGDVVNFAREYNSGWVNMWYDGLQVAKDSFIARNDKRFDGTPAESYVWRNMALLKDGLKPNGFMAISASVNPFGQLAAYALNDNGCGLEIQGVETSRNSLSLADVTNDGRFNSADLVTIFAAGKYELDQPATWYEGDWNWDNRFNTADLIVAFRAGVYTSAAVPVPEPRGLVLLLIGPFLISYRTRGRD